MDAKLATPPSPPETGIGVVLFTSLASPSCPTESCPQQYAFPLPVSPQACSPPTEIVLNESPEVRSVGVSDPPFEPLPSLPNCPSPQQYPAPSAAIPQAKPSPAEIDENTSSGATRIGERLH